jgi:CO/xanthine dehydrogenase FAD-binding subunit
VYPELAQGLVGSRLEEAIIADAATRAVALLDPGNDLNASADYRRHLAGVLTARVLCAARDRAIVQRAARTQP